MNHSKSKNRQLPLVLVIIFDLLFGGAVLLCFAFFHHVLPSIITQRELEQFQAQQSPPMYVAPTAPSTISPTDSTGDTVVVDNRTEWQKKFADKFTDEVVISENSYTSPDVSVTVDTVVETIGGRKVTYYVADVYIGSIDNFKTYTAHDQMRYYITQNVEAMARNSNAIIALSGDYFSSQKSGFIVRNGYVYLQDRNNAICVLFPDGTMETYEAGTYNIDDILSRDPIHVWSFGPVLLDKNGGVMPSYEVSSGLRSAHPRSAVGYYEPGHYCFITVDGRQNHSYGVEVKELAEIFAKLGCKAAYNLDGGASAVMAFDGEIISKPSNGGRDIADILLITDYRYYTGMGDE